MHPDHIRLQRAHKRLGRVNPFFRYGLPIISITIGGFFGIGHILQGRRDLETMREEREWEVLAATKALTPEGPLSPLLAKEKKVTTLEEELRAIQKDINIDEFEYVAVPKPFERRPDPAQPTK